MSSNINLDIDINYEKDETRVGGRLLKGDLLTAFHEWRNAEQKYHEASQKFKKLYFGDKSVEKE